MADTPKQPPLAPVADPVGLRDTLLKLMACPDLASRAWVWNQYDSTIGGQTVHRPGQADAAVVKLEGLDRALAITTDCTPRYCAADPEEGGKQAVAEAWRNLTATGARPLAITDNMNFGNPEKPLIMGQFAGCVRGIAAACLALDFPVVSGNVSLYNETEGRGILPTPAIGGLGVLDNVNDCRGINLLPGSHLVAIGDTHGHLGQSLWLREVLGREEGPPPQVDLEAERRNGDFVRAQFAEHDVWACHDVSDGGLLVAVAEMAMMAGSVGVTLTVEGDHAFWFGEDQARYVLNVQDAAALLEAAQAAGVPAQVIGTTGGDHLTLPGLPPISLTDLREANRRFFPDWMGT